MKYPTGIKVTKTSHVNYANRGMSLEEDINMTNTYYLEQDIAVIYKKPTPITIAKVDYPSRREAIIKEAYFKTPSTTDYNGIYHGYYIDFEAKETTKETFPLSNIHQHQIEHLKRVIKHGGIAFLLVRFQTKNETFLLPAENFLTFIKTEKRKSIPYTYFQNHAYTVPVKWNPRIDYLSIIDTILKERSYEKDNR